MIVGLGVNNQNGRRAVLISLDSNDLEHLIAGGIELNKEAHAGFPNDLEIIIVTAQDNTTLALALQHHPAVTLIRPSGEPVTHNQG